MKDIFNIDFSKAETYLIVALRLSIALVFIWFGGLKMLGFNPVYELVHSTFPIFATEVGNVTLGLIEVLIGLGLVFDFFPLLIHSALLAHLAGTLLTFVSAPSLMFEPYFPILTLSGEFVVKNIVLALAGMVTLVHREKFLHRNV